jgi:hypothetical protein
MTPELFCIAVASILAGVAYMLGWLDARDRYTPQQRQDRNWEYLRGLLDMKAMYSGCVRRDGKSGRYVGGKK